MGSAHLARRLLLLATAGMGMGMALLMRTGTAIGSRLFMNEELVHPQAVAIERGLALLAMVCVVALAHARLRMLASAGLLLLAATLAWATMDQGGHPFSQWAFASQAMRITAPLALLLACASPWDTEEVPPRRTLSQPVMAMLHASAVVVFVMHGVEALRAHPWFVDLTIAAVREVAGSTLAQATVEQMLVAVGVVDIACAVALLTRRGRGVVYWMAAWGAFTASLRVLAYGSGALGDMLVRTPHAVLPLVIAMASANAVRSPSRPSATRPASATGAHPAAGTGY